MYNIVYFLKHVTMFGHAAIIQCHNEFIQKVTNVIKDNYKVFQNTFLEC